MIQFDDKTAEALEYVRKAEKIMAELGHTKYSLSGMCSAAMRHDLEKEVCQLLDKLSEARRELVEAQNILNQCLSIMPVGYVPTHTVENLPEMISDLAKALAEETTEREQLERELAEAKSEAEKWEKLHDADTAHLVSKQQRDNYGPTETLNETAIRLSQELTEAQRFNDASIIDAKLLDRDLQATRQELNEWKTLQTWGGTPQIVDEFIKGQQTRIHAAQDAEKQRDMLADALGQVRAICLDKTIETHPDEHTKGTIDNCIDIAESALAAVKGGEA